MLCHVITTLLITGSFALEHFVDHVLDVSRLGFFFDFGPVLHDSVLELNTQLIPSKGFVVEIDIMFVVIVEDVVNGKRVKRCIEHLFHKLALSL